MIDDRRSRSPAGSFPWGLGPDSLDWTRLLDDLRRLAGQMALEQGEDAVQEVLLQILAKPRPSSFLRSIRRPERYFRRALSNTGRRVHRLRRQDDLLREDLRRIASIPGPEAALRWNAVEEAFSRLRREDRLLLQLRFGEGESLAALGRRIGVSKSTVARRLDALIEDLRRG